MNYFEHHIGDYDKNTAHLTACEDGIYSRMIRRYYDKEKPLPADVAEIKRLVRARSTEEKKAVANVLSEFFFQAADGWHHKTCDEVIATYQAGEPEREAKKANEDNRVKRHRAERAELFKVLTDAGQHAPWNIKMDELRVMVSALQATGPETKPVTAPATAPATPATATRHQTPDTTTQTPVVKKIPPKPPKGGANRFEEFWIAWPRHDRKQDKKTCGERWSKEELDAVADDIMNDVRAKRGTKKWRDGFIEAPLVYLNRRRWEDGNTAVEQLEEAPFV